ncbi:MAG: hypothetical protein K0S63_934 [Gammaproteobacteria bacterium]|jgi:transcriptional regulator with XRE-family HTH domain|nr:hypothetical protein [Gammaproteobacteria bacterium]
MLSEMTLRKEIGMRLQQARENAGYISAKEFCQRNNLSLEPYFAYEKGESVIKISQLLSYSERLQVSVSWLILGVLSEKSRKNKINLVEPANDSL